MFLKNKISVRTLHRIKSSVVSFTRTEFILETLPKSGLCKVDHDSAKSKAQFWQSHLLAYISSPAYLRNLGKKRKKSNPGAN
jgi:hypothetical protein